jgi:predicted RNA binding protein YcfA (HicA-like mRNA interferase family)
MAKLTGKQRKLLDRVMGGRSDANIPFSGLCALLERLGFERVRTEGSHQTYIHKDVPEIVVLQPEKGKAKPYQVKQVRNLLNKYKISQRLREAREA